MRKEDDCMQEFDAEVENIIMTKLASVDENVKKIDDSYSESTIVQILKDSNSIVRLACGGDDDLFEEWKYRLIKSGKHKYTIIQGRVIDLETRSAFDIGEE